MTLSHDLTWPRVCVCVCAQPAGIFHRFSLDDGGRIRAVRLFQDEPKWLAVNRNAETERCATRARYLARFASVPSASEHHTTSE